MGNLDIVFLYLRQKYAVGTKRIETVLWAPKTNVKYYGKENIHSFTLKIYVNLDIRKIFAIHAEMQILDIPDIYSSCKCLLGNRKTLAQFENQALDVRCSNMYEKSAFY